jgi:ATP-dependent DNA helicase RecQ
VDERPGAPTLQDARAALRELFGHDDFRAGQEAVVRAVLEGRDVLAIMPTGAGKSLCYQLPAMLLDGCTLVISPLLALMKDQIDSLPQPVHERTTVLNSLIERDELLARQSALAERRFKLVYATPERLRQRPFIHALRKADVSMVVVDEAHCVSLWGHDFRPDYLFVHRALDLLGRPRLLAMTATATPAIQAELGDRFGRELSTLTTGVLRTNLRLEVEECADREAKLRAIVQLCQEERGSGIVYVTSREQTEELALMLRRRGVNAQHYHAGMDRGRREDAQNAYMLDRTRVMVATTAFGMGVDKANVRFVVHFTPPRSIEAYVQESGRAGRDGRAARCVLLVSRGDRANLRRWIHQDQIDVGFLRRVYAAIRKGAADRYALTTAEDLARRVADDPDGATDETELRAAIALLERVGLLRRHLDLPRTIALELLFDPASNGTCPPELREVAELLGARRRGPIAGRTIDLAHEAGIAPDRLEALALEWQDQGLVRSRSSSREMLLELLPTPADASTRVPALLAQWEQAQERRLDDLMQYVATRLCRHQFIARHFGVQAPERCAMCDVCMQSVALDAAAPDESRSVRDVHPGDVVLDCLRTLPFQIGKRKLVYVLRGSMQSPIGPDRCQRFGALSHLSAAQVGREIDRLVEDGYVARDDGDFPVLTVTPEGAEKPPEPPPPIVERPVRAATPRGGRSTPLTPGEPYTPDARADALFERLRAWRRIQADTEGVPPYFVFSDATLRDIARVWPTDERSLNRVRGLGPAKIERYGQAVLGLIAQGDEVEEDEDAGL